MDLSEAWPWIATVVIGLTVVVLAKKWWSSRNEPPGPWGLPVVGYLPFLGRKMNLVIDNLAKKYGEVYQFKMGSRKVVVISGEKAIQQALLDSGTTFAGRPDFYSYVAASSYGFGDFSPSYRVWKKTVLKTIGEFTKLRQKDLEHVAQNTAVMFMREVEDVHGEPFDPQPLLYRVTCSIIGFICFGKAFDMNDKDVTTILDHGKKFAGYVAFGVVCDFIPWTKFLLRNRMQEYENYMKKGDEMSRKIIEKNEDPSDGNTLRRILQRQKEDMTESEKKAFDVEKICFRLFGAGFGTVAATLRYSLLMMALNPDIQSKVREELSRVVGQSRFPEYKDRNKSPYTLATLTEIDRHYSLSPLGVTHATTCDTEFHGYSIAKGTPVIFNYSSINRGEGIFKEADKFRPERFLNDDGSFNTAAANLVVPFGLGQRRCAGEQLARLEVFLFFATFIQRCVIEQSPDHPLDPDNYYMAFGKALKPFKVIIRVRNTE